MPKDATQQIISTYVFYNVYQSAYSGQVLIYISKDMYIRIEIQK